ncbi:scavenger receptor cysteine-rich type 1 protein M130-like isoform X2 [Dromiciops gliroides]|uniref:scavenger receptor cysteine-rich type 1 protein M130-like isoform X2 n=1 Tax=Dromiciops gliroides TaxID=33562 RepID=UPI001CC38751|nr:scavenger receptor cysteine-rich type 1 protein M130-like isoform X2 [Dromiciops gliroides]
MVPFSGSASLAEDREETSVPQTEMSRYRWIPPADFPHKQFGTYRPQMNPWIYGLPILFLSAYFITRCGGDSNLDLRLANGSSKCAGRVEVKFQAQWGQVCNDGWGKNEISVVCKQLGCPSTFFIPGRKNLTVTPGPFWLAGVSCHGNESALWDCRHSGWREHNCTHGQDAQVTCTGEEDLELRLADGANHCEGRVELKVKGEWGTVCDDSWGNMEASIVCRQLGCGSVLHFLGNAKNGSGPIWLDEVSCLGNESALWNCQHSGWGEHNCNHDEDVFIICSKGADLSLRLGSGVNSCSGRVEVRINNEWGTVCDDNWNKNAEAVVCRQAGCPSAISALISVNASDDIEHIWFDDVSCNGNESALWDCKHRGWKTHDCGHSEDVGVMCSDSSALELRLLGGSSQCAGVVQVRVHEEVGIVCRRSWSLDEATMVCKQLGCGVAVSIPLEHSFGTISEHVWITGIKCYGKEESFGDCGNWEWGKISCHEDEKAAVICSDHMQPRLSGGDFPCSGRVEVKYEDSWVSVCSPDFPLQTASVLCRELQCGTLVSLLDGASFGEGGGQVLPELLQCTGNESHVTLCPTVPIHGRKCSSDRTIGIICSRYRDFRLMDGNSRCEGRVEIQVQGVWGALCGSHWDLTNANVLCKQLDCGVAVSASTGVYFGKARGPVWGHTYHCSGTEPHLETCPMTALGAPHCSPENTALVNCSGNQQDDQFQCQDAQPQLPLCSELRQINLVNGGDRCAGRVEVYHDGAWGTICDDSWDLNDAQVVCRQLGCGVAYNATISAHFGAGTGPIWLDDVNCSGNESKVWQCPSRDWGQHKCRHKEDAGVLCSEVMSLRLLSETNSQACEGRLEVFYNGIWGSVGRQNMTAVTVGVVCRHLGCGDSGILDFAHTNEASSRTMWVNGVQCPKGPTSLWQCPSDPWEKRPSNAIEEAWITCVGKIRVRGGGDKCSGRVEVWHEGSWGTVCDDAWDLADAEVTCQQLGCGSALGAPGEAAFGQGIGPIWLNNVHCKGNESSLWDCVADPWGQTDCGHKEDAGVRCSGVPTTRELQESSGHKALKLFWVLGAVLIVLFLLALFLWCKARGWTDQIRGNVLQEAVYKKMGVPQKEDEDLHLFNHPEAPNGLSGVPRSGFEVAGGVSEPESLCISWVNKRDALASPEERSRNRNSTSQYLQFLEIDTTL